MFIHFYLPNVNVVSNVYRYDKYLLVDVEAVFELQAAQILPHRNSGSLFRKLDFAVKKN